MKIYREFCRLRDLHTPGANVPKHTEADAFFMAAAQLAVPDGYKLVPLEPTPEIIAAAAIAVWPTATPADIALARLAAPIVLMQMDMAPGTTVDSVAGMLATMAPAYRAMLAAAPIPPMAKQHADDSESNADLRYPASMSAALADVLGLPNFRTGPIAHVYRAAGAEIRTKCEDEQAFVLDRFLRLAIEHGEDWRTAAEADLKAAYTRAESSKAVKS